MVEICHHTLQTEIGCSFGRDCKNRGPHVTAGVRGAISLLFDIFIIQGIYSEEFSSEEKKSMGQLFFESLMDCTYMQ